MKRSRSTSEPFDGRADTSPPLHLDGADAALLVRPLRGPVSCSPANGRAFALHTRRLRGHQMRAPNAFWPGAGHLEQILRGSMVLRVSMFAMTWLNRRAAHSSYTGSTAAKHIRKKKFAAIQSGSGISRGRFTRTQQTVDCTRTHLDRARIRCNPAVLHGTQDKDPATRLFEDRIALIRNTFDCPLRDAHK